MKSFEKVKKCKRGDILLTIKDNLKGLRLSERFRKTLRNASNTNFSTYRTPVREIISKAKKYSRFENVVLIGYGGSINNFKAMYYALGSEKNVFMVNTLEPEYLDNIIKKCKPGKTVVIVVSKSGNTISVLENLILFMNKGYKNIVCITQGGALKEIALREGFEIVEHPNIGGRFSALTPSALFPAKVCGINIERIVRGARRIYKNPKHIVDVAIKLYKLERKGYTEIFLSAYSEKLIGILWLITQLIHETTGKNKKGQSVIFAIGPESQHETNQRFFGGRRNMVGFFIKIKEHKNMRIKVPKNMRDIKVKNESIMILDNLNLADSIHYELEGVLEHAKKNKIPHFILELKKLNEESVGELIAFWQYLAYYSALLRKQNPFDQPEVEYSKKKTIELIRRDKEDYRN